MVVIEGLFPVFSLIALGRALRHFQVTGDAFLATSDKLIYYIFFPALLFWKIGGEGRGSGDAWTLALACLCAVLCIYILSTLYIILSVRPFDAGTFSQSCYRFNTYIGMAIILNVLGDGAVRLFGVVIGIAIPVINLLAVSTLIWYSGRAVSARQRLTMTVRALVMNPLILACAAGLIHARLFGAFPRFLDNTFRLAATVALPLALISIGGALTLENWRRNFRLSMVAGGFKLLMFPVVGYGCLRAFGISGEAFKVGMLFFALPTSTAIYVLSGQLNSNTALASAAIVSSTTLSFLSLSAVLLWIV